MLEQSSSDTSGEASCCFAKLDQHWSQLDGCAPTERALRFCLDKTETRGMTDTAPQGSLVGGCAVSTQVSGESRLEAQERFPFTPYVCIDN
jgi:hypothetical protein